VPPSPKRSQGGRPPKPPGDVLSIQISFRVTEELAKQADEEARRRGLRGGKNEMARTLLERSLRRGR
jgi:hypothetical protein